MKATDLERIRRFGGALSHIACDPACRAFEPTGGAGALPYILVGRCAVVFGDPLGDVSAWDAVEDAFSAHCLDKGWVSVRVATKQRRRASDEASCAFADLVFSNPQVDATSGHAGRHLRQNLNHVRRAVTVREYAGTDADLEARAQSTCDRWQKAHRKPSIFIGTPRLFTDRVGRRWFVAERDGDVVGLLSLLRAGNLDGGYLVNLVFAAPDAPGHTTDLLVCDALAQLRAEGVACVCLGLAPRAALGEVEGFSRTSTALATRIYDTSARFMQLGGLAAFWTKFGVIRREPTFLRFQPGRIGMRHLWGLTRALHLSL